MFYSCKNKPEINLSMDPGLSEISEMITRYPINDSLYYLRAEWNYQQNYFKEAITDLLYAIKLDSLQPRYHHLLADALLDHNQSYEALARMKEAVRLFPSRISTLLKLAEFQNILKQYDESIKTCLRVLDIDPLYAEAYLMVGINYRDLKDTVNAILSLQKATAYDDKLSDGWILQARLNSMKNNAYAEKCLSNAYKIDSNSIPTLHAMADFYQDQQPLKSLHYYEKMVSLDPIYLEAIINAGIIYFSLDSFTKALEHFNILCERDPANSLFYYHRGTVKEAMNNKAGARSDYKMAVNLEPKNEEYLSALKLLDK